MQKVKTWKQYHYNQQAVTTEIRAESSSTIVIPINGKDTYYKVSYGETRTVPLSANMEMEKKILFDDINKVVDDQVMEIVSAYSEQAKK